MSVTDGHHSGRRRATLAATLLVLGPLVAVSPAVWRLPPVPVIDLVNSSSFPLDPIAGTIADVPMALRGLDGRRVTVVAYPYAGHAVAGGGPYQLVGGFNSGRYHQPPMVQDRVFATVVPGREGATAARVLDGGAANTMNTVVESTGVFHVRVSHDDAGNINSVFRLDVDAARRAGTPEPVPPLVVAARAAGAAVVATGMALLIGLAWDRHRRQLARLGFCCPECGYDLRASPGRCPECGAVPT